MRVLKTSLPNSMSARLALWTCLSVIAMLIAGSDLRAAEPGVSPADRAKIEQALPAKAPAAPKKARKLLIFPVNVGYGNGHASIPHASLAFSLMGKKTGAFETVVSRDPEVFRPQSLKQFDAVLLNNTVGNLFTDPELRRSLMDFVSGGGGLLGHRAADGSIARDGRPGPAR